MSETIIFTENNIREFEGWLGLNYDALTWQGRYESEFNTFWQAFFVPGQSLEQMVERFRYALLYAEIGPLHSWFIWLRDCFFCFTYMKKPLSVLELSNTVGVPYDSLGIILREFFLEQFPEYEEELSEKFQLANRVSPNLNLTYRDLKEYLSLTEAAEHKNNESVLNSMEVTLYPEWKVLNNKIQKDLFHPNFDFSRIKTNLSFSRQLKVFREILIFLLIGVGLVLLTQKMNKKWEKAILEQISIYEPQLKWLDTSLTFKENEKGNKKDFELGARELDEVENKESQFDALGFEQEVRYEEESDVVLTSWDALPKDFDAVNLEQSDYEELKKRGYRDSRYGNTKVYRVLMRSVDTATSKGRLNTLMKKYKVTRVDNVAPGKRVPGGIYYNLFVPRPYLKEFMAQVMEFDDAVLYESRTRSGRNPPGKNKVFIWVKNI
ncbi:MAG: hypothetical protein NXH75_00670 [Halobacteriovoraceae bacterium]|nr:hypothetical protein [Halobacteriovoraceae bacterium]